MLEDNDDDTLPFVTSDAPPPDEMVRRLSEEMSRLSTQQRNDALNDVHGVASLPKETPEFVQDKLEALEAYLQGKSRDGRFLNYRKAAMQDYSYVSSRAFRLMFLRAELYDVPSAGDRMELHFKYKLKLFGEEKLASDIQLEDMSYGDLYSLNSGYYSASQVVDQSGRAILFIRPAKQRYYKIEDFMRSFWFVVMEMLKSESAQLNGIVAVADNSGSVPNQDLKYLQDSSMARHAVPWRLCASHLLITDPNDEPLGKFLPYTFEKPHRLRFRSHMVSDQKELFGSLRSFGISLAAFELPNHSEMNMAASCANMQQIYQYIRERQSQLIGQTQPLRLTASDSNASNSRVENAMSGDNTIANDTPHGIKPGPSDVLLGRGLLREHQGTQYLHQLVKGHLEKYIAANRREKSEIIQSIVQLIHASGGRFLRRAESFDEYELSIRWKEVEMNGAIKKVSNTFARYRKQYLKRSVSL